MNLRATFLLLAVLLPAASGAQQPLPAPFPRTNATLLFQNDRINVYDIVWPKGQPTALHRHVYDQVGTYYARGGRTITTPDGQARSSMTEVGALSTTRKGTTHVEEGSTAPPLQAVFIELKSETPSGQSPAEVGAAPFPRDGAKQVFDDERVTVWDVEWASGAPGFAYRAARETVVVFLGDSRIRTSSASGAGSPSDSAIKAGSVRHLDRGSAEQLEVVGGAVRALLFQLK